MKEDEAAKSWDEWVEEKAEFDAAIPEHIVLRDGTQYLAWADGKKEIIGPDHPRYDHEAEL